MAQKQNTLSIDNAWNAVALEERLELISRAQAQGIMAAVSFVFLMGSVAYGFDKIWILGGAVIGSLLIIPLFSSYCWRRGKPELILKYLAVRSIARRYAFGAGVPELDIILIYRGLAREIFKSEDDLIAKRSAETVNFDTAVSDTKEVWICLMRGAVVLLSERPGGAKLEFLSPITADVDLDKVKDQDAARGTLTFTGTGQARGREFWIWSNYPAAHYVFERQVARIVAEAAAKLAAVEKSSQRHR